MSVPSTSWSATASGPPAEAILQVSINGGAARNFSIRAACYSPCPINGSNAYGPNLGDWFWDSFSGEGYNITGWNVLWARDFPNLRAMGANTIRVYNMISRQLNSNGSYPDPWNSGQLFTHTNFLNACQDAGLYVLVGVALPEQMFWSNPPGPAALPGQIEFWKNVLLETAIQVGTHPAVLGFIFMNEWDSSEVTYPNSQRTNLEAVQYWWSQVQRMAKIVKEAAPTKLTGIAVHDDPNICGLAASYMAQCPSVDFWGVNTYQTESFDPVFVATGAGPGYGGLTGAALKPVLLTEWGMPATTRTDGPSTICQTSQSIDKAAAVIASMLPKAYAERLCIGLTYFEYCDEWWNQGGSPNIYTWWGGSSAAGFPNRYWDQDGFGLYQTVAGAGKGGGNIWCQDGGNGQPCSPIDTMVERAATVKAVAKVFG